MYWFLIQMYWFLIKLYWFLITFIEVLFFACTTEELADPITGSWSATVYEGYNVEKRLNIYFSFKNII